MRTFSDLRRIIGCDVFHPDDELDDKFINALNKWMSSERPFELRLDMKVKDFPRNSDGRTFSDLRRIIGCDVFHPDDELDDKFINALNKWMSSERPDDKFINALNKWMSSERPFELRLDMKVKDFPRNSDGSLAEGFSDDIYILKTLVVRDKDGECSIFVIHPLTGKEVPVDGLKYHDHEERP